MFIVWGTGLYGKVDSIPGLGHVATRFGHLYYIPLIPMETVFVLQESLGNYHGVAIGSSGKSVLVAWLRFALGVICLASGVWCGVNLMDRRPDWSSGIMLPIGTLFGFIATYFVFGRAGYARARALATEIGLNELGLLRLDVAYQRITAEEAANEEQLLMRQAAAAGSQAPQPALDEASQESV